MQVAVVTLFPQMFEAIERWIASIRGSTRLTATAVSTTGPTAAAREW